MVNQTQFGPQFAAKSIAFSLLFACIGVLAELPAWAAEAVNTPVEAAADETPNLYETILSNGLREHPWTRYVRRFRSDHNFAFVGGAASGLYKIKSFGQIVDQDVQSGAAWAKFQYSFHVQLYRGLGYLLGSAVGYYYERADRSRAFQPTPMVMYPGILAGLTWNLNPLWRVSAAADVHMVRADGLTSYYAPDRSRTERISVTLVAYDAGFFLDYFYDLNWGLRLETHKRSVYYYSPLQQPGDKTVYASDAVFRLEDRWYGVGLVYHLL